MTKFIMNIENQKSKIGQLPGSITYTGKDTSTEISLELITYDEDSFNHKKLNSIDELDLTDDGKLKWIKVVGLNNTEIITQIGEKLGLNELILEDVVNVEHAPKVEFDSNCLFLILKILAFDNDKLELNIEHVSFVMFEHILVSFQEYENDVFDYREKIISEHNSLIRKRKIDYLLYSLVDSIVDEYFIVIENIEEKMEELEIYIINDREEEHLYTVYKIRKEMSKLKRLVWPVEGALRIIIRENDGIDDDSLKYFKEINDNLIQLMDFINMDRDLILGIFDLYLSNNGNRMNKAMQTLTVVATIFTPMTFLTGVYGMNFKYMPEHYHKAAYPIFWIVAILNMTILYRYYKRKGWI